VNIYGKLPIFLVFAPGGSSQSGASEAGVYYFHFVIIFSIMNKRALLVSISTLCVLVGIAAYGRIPKIENVAQDNSASSDASYLRSVVGDVLEGTEGTYGIVIQHLKTGEVYYANEHRAFDAVSLYKLWVMATVYNQIQNGQLQKDQVLSQSVATLGTATFTIQEALTQMITISHNYAALLLMEKIKLSSVAAFLKDNGFIESAVGTDDGSLF